MLNVNEYFEGKVKSIAYQTETLPASVGVMSVGDYVFNTADKETMTVITGSLEITFNGETESQTFGAGESFDVAANSSFDVKVKEETAYLCTYG
ncbi:Pyrimidine/purine nucleoside phosphorylase [Nymphon striatum]|nr:Pyrimidine/purine nucleoside phosphorylase [Nymphon striatum]